MAHEAYLKAKFTKQGQSKGESLRKTRQDWIPVLDFEYDVLAPYDVATGHPTGRRQHSPLVIIHEIGSSSPQFFQALCTNETLTEVTLELVTTGAGGVQAKGVTGGEEKPYYQFKLTNANVVKIEQYREEGSREEAATHSHDLEKISFTFQKIEVNAILAKTTAIDDWTLN
jgi:type VI secretion system secreted protein Hcp